VARSALARPSAPIRSNKPSPKLVKLEARLANLGNKARAKVLESETRLVNVAAPVAFAVLESKVAVPSPFGVDPALALGLLGVVVGMNMKGKTGKLIDAGADGLLGFGAARSAVRGSIFKAAGSGADDMNDGLSGTEILG
jgi:hypothetical protein